MTRFLFFLVVVLLVGCESLPQWLEATGDAAQDGLDAVREHQPTNPADWIGWALAALAGVAVTARGIYKKLKKPPNV